MRIAILALIAILSACRASGESGASDSEVTLTVEPDEATPGDTLVLTLRNRSAGEIGYNLCASGLERPSDGGWTPVPSDRICTMELRMLAPNQDFQYSMELPEDIAPGEYRYQTTIELSDQGTRRDVVSETFRVRS